VHHMLKNIRWKRDMIGDFLGGYLSEPKPHVVFYPPAAIGLARFTDNIMCDGLQLDLKSQALFHAKSFFMNGERICMQDGWASCLKYLADHRCLSASSLQQADTDLVAQLHQWHLAGYLHCGAG